MPVRASQCCLPVLCRRLFWLVIRRFAWLRQVLVDPAVPGLILGVGPSGSKRWLFRFRWKRSRPRIALGEIPDLGLAEARDRAIEFLCLRSDRGYWGGGQPGEPGVAQWHVVTFVDPLPSDTRFAWRHIATPKTFVRGARH